MFFCPNLNSCMAKKNELILSIESIINSDCVEKKDRVKFLLEIGFFGVSDKEKERLLNLLNPKTETKPARKRKKSNGTQEEAI